MILRSTEDFELRVHHRAQMDASGLRLILKKCEEFNFPTVNTQLELFATMLEEDHERMVENFDAEVLRDMSNPEDVFRAIMRSVEGTPAKPHFTSAMQHLLLIREEGDILVRFYQLIESLITSVVLDKKHSFEGGLSAAVGVSVARLVAQFGEQDRAAKAEEDAAEARRELSRLRTEKELLDEELGRGQEGLVGDLKERLTAMEEKLRLSRQAKDVADKRLQEKAREYEERILQLETQIMELFRMLKDTDGFDSISQAGGAGGGSELISSLTRQLERRKTRGILEGRHKKPNDGSDTSEDDSFDEADATIGAIGSVRERRRKDGSKLKPQNSNAQAGRSSQFMDADDEHVRLHMEENLAAVPNAMVSVCHYLSWSKFDFGL
jgi:cytokinesis protein